jgi:poly-gamma-glutamate capsule biosynthesis protein CapA/YwtB (metallophosphatase superfamily)
MNLGRVYIWLRDPSHPLHGRVNKEVVPLQNLEPDAASNDGLCGRYVRVRNAGWVNEGANGSVRPVPLGNARADANGDFLYEPGRGGTRVDKVELHPFQSRYVRAAHFGEVNTYYHLDLIASYVHELLAELNAPPLPPVIAVVNAHNAATDKPKGIRDGLLRSERWLPFQGGHYRLASHKYDICEHEAVSPDGEIHFGPGWQLWQHGALAERSRKGYRANASHNAGIIYHEYGHHITRHTADFRANCLCAPDNQNNRKTAMDEGTCDYWAATMLGTPHIWAWHQRHDDKVVHPRSLVSAKTMADFDHDKKADPHLNGTIWGAALWDLRGKLSASEPSGARHTDLLLLKALLLIGKMMGKKSPPTSKSVREARKTFGVGLSALLEADEILFGNRHRELILKTFARRGISPSSPGEAAAIPRQDGGPHGAFLTMSRGSLLESSAAMKGLLKHVSLDEIPETDDLFSGEGLESHLRNLDEPALSFVAVGDIMLGGRAHKVVSEFGPGYPFEAVLPLLQRAAIGLGNLEGPFARKAQKLERNHSYRVNPKLAKSLLRARINVVTLANNHLLDCGREGVLETLDALAHAGVAAIGAGVNKQAAHAPAILQAGPYRVGLLGYYWNRRTAARGKLPGSAMDPAENLTADIGALRQQVDRVVVTFHWGVPYVREPSAEDRAKARLAIDCGADVVIGHHPHIVQPFEIYRGRPIFFSIGNFTFGSGNTRGESLLLGVRFEEKKTVVQVYPVYVKNRDPRVNYQPKVLRANAAARILQMLAQISSEHGASMKIENHCGLLELPWSRKAE